MDILEFLDGFEEKRTCRFFFSILAGFMAILHLTAAVDCDLATPSVNLTLPKYKALPKTTFEAADQPTQATALTALPRCSKENADSSPAQWCTNPAPAPPGDPFA